MSSCRRHVQLLQRLEDVERLGPAAVVLAPAPSLAAGPARALLTRWATDERNLIVIPGRPPVRRMPRSLAVARVTFRVPSSGIQGPRWWQDPVSCVWQQRTTAHLQRALKCVSH